MKKEREALKSGVCRMKGWVVSQHNKDPKLDVDGPLTMFYAFDGPAKLRFDRDFPGWVMVPGSAVPDPNHPGAVLRYDQKRGITGQKYCKNCKRAAYWWDTHSGQVVIDGKVHDPPPAVFGWWDIRAAGLNSSQMIMAQAFDLDRILQVYADFEVKYGVQPQVNKSDPNRWVVSWSYPASVFQTETRFSVDVNRGFTPVAFVEEWRSKKSDQAIVWQLIKATWEEKKGVWVPTHVETQHEPHSRQRFDVSWEKINEPVDESLFDYRSFGATPQINIVDMTLGQPVLLQEASGGSPSLVTQPVAAASGWKWQAIAGVSALLALIAPWVVWRILRSRHIGAGNHSGT